MYSKFVEVISSFETLKNIGKTFHPSNQTSAILSKNLQKKKKANWIFSVGSMWNLYRDSHWKPLSD